MTGAERRTQIVQAIQQSTAPISATKLANEYSVSRQVIVQDVALLRASGYDIVSTNRGYLIKKLPERVSRVFKVRHTDDALQRELFAIVDLGGCVENVMVNHKVYGKLEAPLNLDSRRRVEDFLVSIRSGKASTLKNITGDYHYHRISAAKEDTLEIIEGALDRLGFLVPENNEEA